MPVYTCSLKNPGIGSLNLSWCRMLNNKTTSPLLSRCRHLLLSLQTTRLVPRLPGTKVPYFGPDGQNPRRHSRGPRGIRDKNFTAAEKILDFSRTGLAKDCQKVRKRLPRLRWGSKKHSKESGSGVFARDSEVEREVYLNLKKSYQRPSN